MYLGGVEVRAYHLGRGHTNGDAVIYFPDLRTIHGGDLLHGISPFIDYANGGSSREWVTTLNNILQIDFDTAIPGHGDVMTKDDVRAFRGQFQTLRRRMSELVRAGVSKDEVAERLKTDEAQLDNAAGGVVYAAQSAGFLRRDRRRAVGRARLAAEHRLS